MTNELTQLFAARLAESEVAETEAHYAGLRLLTAEHTVQLYAGAPRQGAIKIVYHTPAGKATPFYRLRLLGRAQGLNGQSAKPRRYLQPPESGVRAYLPRVRGTNWLEILTDPEVALIITEGEFKALAATLRGFPTIGLGGVENWRSAKQRTPLIAELAAIEWKDRNLYIAYDSDVATKPQVAEASRRLAEELGARGARVYDAGLPGGAQKVGLDDFLRDRGAKALEKHLAEAPEFVSVAQLHDFNERFIFVRRSGQVYEPAADEFYASPQFVNATEANAVYTVTKSNGAKVSMERRSTAKDWLAWPQRRSVQRVNYIPGEDNMVVPGPHGPELNLWTGWGVLPSRGSVKPWQALYDHILQNTEQEARKWLLQWFAFPLQHPGTKLFSAVAVCNPRQGTGKTLLGETLLRIYGANGQKITKKQLGGNFNGWMQRRQFVLGDEITGNDSREHADELKDLLTSERVRINEKFEREYDLPNCVNFYFTSNHPDAFFVDDSDRRFLIIDAPDETLTAQFYEEYRKWLLGEGPAALFYYLLHVDLAGFNPRAAPPGTTAKEVMVDQGRTDVGRFISAVMLDPERAEAMYGVPKDVEVFTCAELRAYYDPRWEKRVTEKAIAMELAKQHAAKVLRGMQIRVEGVGRCRLYAVRNTAKWRKVVRIEDVHRYMEKRTTPTPKF